MKLILFSEVLNQLQNWILREPIFSYESQYPLLEFLDHDAILVLRILGLRFISVHKGVLVKIQGCTKPSKLFFSTRLIN